MAKLVIEGSCRVGADDERGLVVVCATPSGMTHPECYYYRNSSELSEAQIARLVAAVNEKRVIDMKYWIHYQEYWDRRNPQLAELFA